MAVTADGAKLAYAVADGVDPDYGDCIVFRLRAVDVTTGATRTWTGDAMLYDLNWAPDDRTLLMHAQGCCGDYSPGITRLDTRSAGTDFDGPDTPGTGDFRACVVSVTASSDTELFAGQECYDANEVRIVVLDPVTGRVGRQVEKMQGIHSAESLSVTADGRHFVLAASGEVDVNYRVDDGTVSQLPTHLDRLVW